MLAKSVRRQIRIYGISACSVSSPKPYQLCFSQTLISMTIYKVFGIESFVCTPLELPYQLFVQPKALPRINCPANKGTALKLLKAFT